MFNFKLICVVIFLFNLHQIRSKISDKRLCANENCTEPISLAKTVLRYNSPDRGVLSFDANVDVTVYSKSAGSNMALWGVEINGQRGYAPTSFLRETKVYTKKIPHLIDTELSDMQVPSIKSDDIQDTIKANKVPEYDVVDGTTIYYNTEEAIVPTPTEHNILPTGVKENVEENNILNVDNVNINHEATQPLELKLDESNENKEKLETNEDVQSNSQENSDEKSINENELKTDDILKDSSSKEIDHISKGNGLKESIVENVLQTITNWMTDETKKNEKDDSIDDYAVVADEEDEESEEDDDDDDSEDDLDNDSEEIDTSDESDINTPKVDSENNGQTSVIEQENYSANVQTEDIVNNNMSSLSEQKNCEEIKETSEEKSSIESINAENIVKTRQLLSETEMFSDESGDEENVINTISLQKEETKEAKGVDDKKIDNETSNMKDTLENLDNSNAPTNHEIPEEYVTESTFTEIPGLEVPVPIDNDLHVTPNPIENIQDDSVTKSEIDIAFDEEDVSNTDDSSNKDSLSSLEEKDELSKPVSDESENAESEKVINHDVADNIDKTEDSDNLLSVDSSPEVTDIEQSLQGESDDFTNESKEAEFAESNESSINVNVNSVDDSKILQINSIDEQAATTNEEEIISKQDSDLTSTGEDKLYESSELSQDIPLESDKDLLQQENQENISGLFSGFTNWLGKKQNQNIEETVSKDELTPNTIEENVYDENLRENNQFQNIDSKAINEKQDLEVNVDISNGNEISKSDNVERIKKHDHGLLSMINEQHDEMLSERSESSQIDNLVPQEITEVPISEKELPEEIFSSQEVLENQELPVEETNKQEDSQAADNLHIFDVHDHLLSKNSVDYGSCSTGESDCPDDLSVIQKQLEMEQVSSTYNFSDYLNLLTLLGATGLSVAIFLLGFITIDKNRKEGTLIAKINTLEKALFVASKENTLLIERVSEIQNETAMENDRISSEEYEQLNKTHQEALMAKSLLEDQIQSLEKELENSTEVGLELNRMLSDIISSQNGSDILIANVEQLQRQLVEQQSTINTINDTLNLKDTENHELQLELEIKNKKVTHLQAELDKMAMNLFKVEEDKEQMQAKLESEILELKDQLEQNKNSFNSIRTKLFDEINSLKTKFSEAQRNLEVKTNEYTILKDNFNQIKTIKNNTEALQSLLNASSMKAELQQLQRDNQALNDVLREEQQTKFTLEKQAEIALQEAQSYKAKYDESDKDKLEALTKLEVLSNYFKDREGQLQKELSKQESMWVEHQGEATSTVERIKYMQEELQNCKSQNELLKQEIVSQEVELKSQISVLEKKAHESWLIARQAERRLEDAKQEAAQLRNRLTLKERSFIEDKAQNRIQSPLEQNGDIGISPLHMPVESPAPPPLLYGTRDHLTTSPPLPNLPPFLPPPPGVPFMPPPIPGVPGFMPPPPSMFPVDHRPPPLGRMSSPPPPLNSRYSPDSRYSPYDRNSPSPPYDDEYGSSPPHLHRGYSPYNNRDDRRDYKRPPPSALTPNGRNKGAISSGSGNSNESLEKINRHHSKV